MPDLTVRVVSELSAVDSTQWNALAHGHSPFLEYEFLRALELSGSVGSNTGWTPYYILIRDRSSHLLGAVPTFLKKHSFGEFIFDWAWARASEQVGLAYYPKLVVSAPMTPATGPRLLVSKSATRPEIIQHLVSAVRQLADEHACSSIHWLFVEEQEHQELSSYGFQPRLSFQFHWHNQGYRHFDDFLARLTSRHRKQIRKERNQARASVDDIQFLRGEEISHHELAWMDRFYRQTTWAHGGMDYLQPGFFHQLWQTMPSRIRMVRVRKKGAMIAGAFYLQKEDALYGRYWGCTEEIRFLHFETAYYAGIEYCIQQNLRLFEAGAQGEHKLLRGFVPCLTYSNHWIRHPNLAAAVDRFLVKERQSIFAHIEELNNFCPYKQ